MSRPVVAVLITAPAVDVAERIAKAVVDERLAACVSILPGVRSIYRWEGAICDEAEVLLIAKAPRDGFDALAARVKALHPYQVPEIVALDVAAGLSPYLAWVLAGTSSAGATR